MKSVALNLGEMDRLYGVVAPLSRIGFLFAHPAQEPLTFTGKLELCLRISSAEEFAEDVIDGETYQTPFPHAILRAPHAVHTYAIDSPREAVYIQYDPSLEPTLKGAGLLTPPTCWPVKMTQEISGLILKMREVVEHLAEPHAADQLDLLAMQFFQALLAQRETEGEVPHYIVQRIQCVASHFHLNVTGTPNLDYLLAKNGLSRRTFFRYWKELYDQTPAHYLRELKLQHACTLLTETNQPIWKITEELKFKDSNYLCRIFKTRFGQTPLQYRKQRQVKA